MQILKITIKLPVPLPSDSPLASLFGLEQGALEIGTEFMIDTDEEARAKGQEFSGMMEAFMEGWGSCLDESS
jgi:hypothetical protein